MGGLMPREHGAYAQLAVMTGVRGVRLQEKLGEAARRRILFLLGMALAGLLAAGLLASARAWMGAVVPGGLAAFLPPALASLGVAVITPHPRHLKHVGWLMVATNIATLVLLVLL